MKLQGTLARFGLPCLMKQLSGQPLAKNHELNGVTPRAKIGVNAVTWRVHRCEHGEPNGLVVWTQCERNVEVHGGRHSGNYLMHVLCPFDRIVTCVDEEVAQHSWLLVIHEPLELMYLAIHAFHRFVHLECPWTLAVHAPSKIHVASSSIHPLSFYKKMWTELIQANVNTNVNIKFGYAN